MDMEALMAQASALQEKVSAAQDKLGGIHIKGIAENGACIIDISGKYDLFDLKIREDVMARGAAAVAELVSAAYRDACRCPNKKTGQTEKNGLLLGHCFGCLAQLIRASRLHREGRGFESLNIHQNFNRQMAVFFIQILI